jgi:predicted RNase H-like HicB family nuclease
MTWIEDITSENECVLKVELLAPPTHYSAWVYRELLADGSPVYVAMCPEIDGAMAQGDSSSEAMASLYEEVIPMMIDYLREDQLPVPAPLSHRSVTGTV